jgi:uncharacterized membrane protein YgdD (TMEM256/DUF423 family)
VHLVLDIFQGVGIAVAVGVRPFLPALAVGALAAGDVQIDFKGTDFSFLQSAPFLIGVLIAVLAVALLERRLGADVIGRGPFVLVLGGLALALGALLFAGALAQDHYASWPGLIGGLACVAFGAVATRPLLGRVRARLGREGPSTVLVYAEGLALAIAVLSVLAPPAGPVSLALLAWLLLAGRRRDDKKYAGLRILR